MTVPVLMLGLDAADADVVDALMARGRMPNLRRLRSRGLYGRLRSPASHYAGGVWPTFYTGTDVPWHGTFHNKLWRPDAMRVEVAGESWIPSRPFWESLGVSGLRVCIVDVPMVLGPSRPVHGCYVGGWGTHDVISRGSWPRDLWLELVARHGAPVMPPEQFGPQRQDALARLPAALSRATTQLRDIAVDLLGREPWDFACVVFGAIHRAGHYLWDQSQVGGGAECGSGGADSPALADAHEEVDAAIGAIVDRLDRDVLVITFAVHGMGANHGWSDLLPDLMTAMESTICGSPPRHGLLFDLKRRVPFHWVRPVLSRMPAAVTNQLVPLWSKGMFDWGSTRYFPMPMDQAGYLRVNLRGRERHGIVEPGAEYDAVCARLERALLGLRALPSGEPLTGQIWRAYAEAHPRAPSRHLLPDLVVPWHGPCARDTHSVVSEDVPGFRFAVPGRLPSGRSGNHTAGAWFAASGPGVGRGVLHREHGVIDLAPTVLRHLGLADPRMQGAPIDLQATR